MRKRSVDFPVLFVVAVFVSFHLYGIGVKQIAGLHFGPWDIAFLILLIPWFAVLTVRGSSKLGRPFIGLLLLASLFALWVAISALLSPQPFRALTMLVQQLRNLLLFIMIGTLFGNLTDIKPLNHAIFWIGTAISTVAVFLYLLAWLNYPKILATPSLWKPNIVYILDQGGVLRLTGFAKDPNFYSLWMAPALFAGLAMPLSFFRLPGLLIVSLSCILAMSRGFILGFTVSTVFLTLAIILRKKTFTNYIRRIVIGLMLVGVIAVLLQTSGLNLLGFFSKRVELIERTPRFVMWQHLISGMENSWNPFLGTGLRGAQELLQGKYSHNSYFDVLFEMGLPGLILWLSILGYTTLIALRRIGNVPWLPWTQTWLVLLVMFGAFSLVYNPFPWLVVGILCASPFKR